ncbi:hypothetical protein V5799_022120 [Amblyomma americanum]|uniref:PID domain-containing protein n=1 Tax=Amblyomma americanum TaxID=6943 RepID=A0AAQ4FLC7_AMBAM
MRRLKEAVRAWPQHKQRVQLTVSLQGIRIRDEKTGARLFHHPVQHISFISQDTSNTLATACIYVAQDESYRYITIKTDKAATEPDAALAVFLQVVLDMKDRAARIAPQAWMQAT